MKMTDEGLALIRRFEGFRSRAYKDASGVWTIGYGHTSSAGAPEVRPLMRITRPNAERILARDVESFAAGVARLVKVPLSDGQFSALVSFAYNVGLENFRKSSVLAAVKRQDFAAVPRRLSLWVKSRGRVLPGLVNRRAAEAALFIAATRHKGPRIDSASEGDCRKTVEPLSGPPMRRSTTSLAAAISGLAGLASSLAAGLGDLTRAASGSAIAAVAALIIVAAAVWIIRERRLKALEDGI